MEQNYRKTTSKEINKKETSNFFSKFFKDLFNSKQEVPILKKHKYKNPKISLSLSSEINNNNNTPEKNYQILPFSLKEWSTIFTSNSPDTIDQSRLLFSLKKGIDKSIRGKVWLLLSRSFKTYKNEYKNNKYSDLLKENNFEAEDLIKRDINRTLLNKNKNEYIKVNPNQLFNVLKAYSIIDKEIGYCQGTNSIVATFLIIINNEEFCFWTFYNFMINNNWRFFFMNGTPKLLRMIEVMKNNFKDKLNDLYVYFKKINFDGYLDIIFSHFFLTVFTYNCPIDLSLRILDLFWVYEEKVIINTIINIIYLEKEKIKKMQNEELIIYLKNEIVFDVVEEYGVDYIINML